METIQQKLLELTDKFNKRLDVVIRANPNENFVVEDQEKSEEMLKSKLHRLRGSNDPLQNQALDYLQRNILELRAEERNLEIAQGKPLGKLFISQEPMDNLLAIFEKLAERKQELQQTQNNEIKSIAEKSLSDSNYLFLFDEKTKENVQILIENTAKSQNHLSPQPLTAEDYLAISNKWVEEMNNPTPMSKGMNINQISEKSSNYYQQYEITLKRENMEQSAQNQVAQESKKEFDVVEHLNTQMKYLGFGDYHSESIKKGIESDEKSFQIHTASDKVMEGNKVDFTINFNKSEKGGVFLNSFAAKLTTAEGEERSHNFRLNFTAKEAINLLEGRAVKTELSNKQGEKYDAFVKLNFAEEKNEYGNYKLQTFTKNYGVDTAQIIDKAGLKFDKPEYRENAIKSLEKGNIIKAKFEYEGKEIKGKAVLNVQYKNISLYDNNMNRLNTNKPLQGLEQDNSHEKNRVKQQNISRSI